MTAAKQVSLGDLLWAGLDLVGHVAASTVRVCAESAATNLCASTSSFSAYDTADYKGMVELGLFDDFSITRVAHCASPIERVGNILEHEFVVIEARHASGEVRFYSLEKVNRGQGKTSTIELHDGPRIIDVFHRAGADGPPRNAPRRRLEFAPTAPVPLRRIFSHVFVHMDKPFSVLSHNCQDFATELVDIIRLAGDAQPLPTAPPAIALLASSGAALEAAPSQAVTIAPSAPADVAAAVQEVLQAAIGAVEAEDEWELVVENAPVRPNEDDIVD